MQTVFERIWSQFRIIHIQIFFILIYGDFYAKKQQQKSWMFFFSQKE